MPGAQWLPIKCLHQRASWSIHQRGPPKKQSRRANRRPTHTYRGKVSEGGGLLGGEECTCQSVNQPSVLHHYPRRRPVVSICLGEVRGRSRSVCLSDRQISGINKTIPQNPAAIPELLIVCTCVTGENYCVVPLSSLRLPIKTSVLKLTGKSCNQN